MSLNQVNSSGELERVAGLVNSEKINEMYEAFPSDASASNKLVAKNDTYTTYSPDTTGYSTWDEFLALLAQKGTGRYTGDANLDDSWWSYIANIGANNSGHWQGEATFTCMSNGSVKVAYKYYNQSSTWTIKDYTPTSTVTSGSTAPITSGGLYPTAITTPTPVSGVTGGDSYIYGYKSGKMVTIALNGVTLANDILQNNPIFNNIPTAVGGFGKNIYFTVLDYNTGKTAVMSVLGNTISAAFQSDDQEKVHAGRYWGTITYMTSD